MRSTVIKEFTGPKRTASPLDESPFRECVELRSPLPRLAGVSTVMRTQHPSPKDINAAGRGRHESAWRLHALREVRICFFNLRE